ncbi:hypothetical protein CYMTET_39093 [Cymbomonas tetramitiformis]|uniref:Chlorophyll a-b binding protein, chloroplastic n=1 Tax=Cymbomonas tetramitiformis TaxID=36881 RepID=A0AAE0F4U7_9CHLO|nr:hypothetical protein CYMTET_39093 [Cymbomonas tetramitiformis]
MVVPWGTPVARDGGLVGHSCPPRERDGGLVGQGTPVPRERDGGITGHVSWGTPTRPARVMVVSWGTPARPARVMVVPWGTPARPARVLAVSWGTPARPVRVMVVSWGTLARPARVMVVSSIVRGTPARPAVYVGIKSLEPVGIFLPGNINYPGGQLFDPLDYSKNADELTKQAVMEIKHGRMAMLGMLGYFVQAAVTQQGPLQNLVDFVEDPSQNNIFKYLA